MDMPHDSTGHQHGATARRPPALFSSGAGARAPPRPAQRARAGALAALSLLGGALLMSSAQAGLVPAPPPAVWFVSPRQFEVLHTDEVQATFRIENAPPSQGGDAGAVLLVNGTEALRTATTQPSVTLSGLAPGICELTVQVLHEHAVVASASALFLISSAARDARGMGSPTEPDADGEWTAAVAFGSDDWGRSADTIPVFPHQGELDQTRRQGWDPGAWGRATVETAGDLERLFDLLEGLNVDGLTPVHQRVVLSPYFVVGGPDFRAMAHTGCPGRARCAYRETLLHQSAGPPAAWPHCRGESN